VIDWDVLKSLLGNGPWILLGLAFVTALEHLRPARPPGTYWRKQFFLDAGAFAVVMASSKLLQPVIQYLNDQLSPLRPEVMDGWLPVWAKVVLVLLVSDFAEYWLHRAMHGFSGPGKLLWLTHRWHHAPPTLTALGGYRGSFLQRVLFGVCFLSAAVFFNLHEPLGLTALAVINIVHELIIHANSNIDLGPLRAFIATPRWHRIHHASEARLQLSNFGMHFTIWDRMFGTYTDPRSVPSDFALGLSDKRDPVRTFIGV
jgi:sterol desaturase/sphingolipid hydroxylase (fatty acid hydroxylase superfamily)